MEGRIVIPGQDIYKICILDSNGKAKRIIVYNGTNAEYPMTKDDEIFSEDEKIRLGLDQPDIQCSPQQIHKDDSIRIIKKKIIQELGKNNVSYEELYLFSGQNNKLHLLKSFLEMTGQGKADFTKHMAGQFLFNILNDPAMDKVTAFTEKINKDVYSYDDFAKEFKSVDDLYTMFVALGRKFSQTTDLLFSGNPFDILPTPELAYIPSSKNTLDAFDNHLLLNYGNLQYNTIYVCLAGDVLKYAAEVAIGEEYMISLYYPLLEKQGVTSNAALIENKEELIKQTQEIMKEKTMKIYDVIDQFYDIYYSRTSEIPYLEKGISSFEFVLHPEFKTLLPLDIIFKQYHAKKHVPYIKYIQGGRQEPIYRLYSTQRTRNGKKIPYLPKNQIMALSKLYSGGRSRKVTLFIQHEQATIFLEFEYNGNIIVRSELKRPIPIREVNELLMTLVNPEIQIINHLLESNGYLLQPFGNLTDDNLEILSMQYGMTIDYKIDIKMAEYIDFLSCAFEIIDKNIDKGAMLKFKRVENYRRMDAMASMITQAFKHNDNDKNVIELLKVNFLLSEEEALGKLRDYLSEHVRIGGQFVNKSINIAENPGFPVILRVVPFENKLAVEIKEINSIDFLDVLDIYLDSFLRITQYPDTTVVTKAKLLEISSTIRKVVDTPHVENVIVQAAAATKVVDIQPFQIQFDSDDIDLEEEEMGGILFEEEEDEEEGKHDEDQGTGQGTEQATGQGEEDNYSQGDDNDGILFEEEDSPEQSVSSQTSQSDLVSRSKQLGGVNMFFKRMKEKDPELFLIRKEGNFGAYTGICPSNISRQPVILSDEEKKEIDEKYPGSYEVALPYSTKPDKKFWYICPRYWCVKTNRPMTKEQVDRGECGGIKQPDKKNLVEFTDEKEHKDKEGRYRQHRPGFLEKNKHPNPNFCLPCCFKNMNSDKQIRRREECNIPDNILSTGKETDEKVVKRLVTKPGTLIDKIRKYLKDYGKLDKPAIQAKLDEYEDREYELLEEVEEEYKVQIDATKERDAEFNESPRAKTEKKVKNAYHVLNFDKFPINQHRWGYLQLSLELFLHTDNSTSATKNNPAILKPNERPLLRYGIEQSRHQSFVGCLADIYTYYKPGPAPTIKEMREIIATAVTLDIFLKAHNGSLVSVFQPPGIFKTVSDLSVEKYRDTAFYKSFQPADFEIPAKNNFLKYTIVSYENFLKFLRDDDSFIDHTYLWDIVTMKETELFSNGLNLVIMEIANNDVTDNVELVCPTNSYSEQAFDSKKGTVLLIKREEFYEPIYRYGNTFYEPNTNTRNQAVKVFQKKDTPAKLLDVFETIRRSTNAKCNAQPSIKKYSSNQGKVVVYEFKENLPAKTVHDLLKQYGYTIKSQIMNYRGKIIALMVVNNAEDPVAVYIPTFPSAIVDGLERKYIDDVIWLPYETTFNKLKQIHEITNGEVRSKPFKRVVEDGIIVGIMTETNQFLQIAEPFENNDVEKYGADNFIEIVTKRGTAESGEKPSTAYYNKYYEIDKQLASQDSPDMLRIQTIRNISLETQFYLAFRIKLRTILNDYTNKEIRQQIVDIIENPSYSYFSKLKKLNEKIELLMTDQVSFVEIAEDALRGMSTFISQGDIKTVCFLKNGAICIPTKNLTNGQDNHVLYFNRISDELLRYNRIRLFLLEPKRYLNVTEVDYSIRDDEIVLLQSILYGKYFDDLLPFHMNEYIQNINFDTANPAMTSERYNNKVSLNEQNQCIVEVMPVMVSESGKPWHTIFPKSVKETVFRNSDICSFDILVEVIKKHLNREETVESIKVELVKIYERHRILYGKNINTLLANQGKFKSIDMILKQRLTYETMIMNDSYFLSNLDLWVLARFYDLPIVLFSSNKIDNMVEGIDWMILNGPLDASFYFIRCNGIKNGEIREEFHLLSEKFLLHELVGLEAPLPKQIQSFDDFLKSLVAFKLVVRP
uniref:Uncharacterized protein n=1 Tax=viral metagenome TaxID=1070528 RepID=A0A6C0JI89_9ZZZZ